MHIGRRTWKAYNWLKTEFWLLVFWWLNFKRLTLTYRTANLQNCILYIYSTNIGTEYFKHGVYSPFFSL